jgi:hypothetical protein
MQLKTGKIELPAKMIIKLTLPKETGRLSMANGEVRAEIA